MRKITYYHVYNGSMFGDPDDPKTKEYIFSNEKEAARCAFFLNGHSSSGPYTYQKLSLTIFSTVDELDDYEVKQNPVNHRILNIKPDIDCSSYDDNQDEF